jgi:pyruvate kinase
VANAVLDETDAVMLSAETAVGDYPVETVLAMARICLNAEREAEDSGLVERRHRNIKFTRVDQSIAMSALYAASHFNVRAIVALTQSGSTALWMSRTNSTVPIFALTPVESTLSKVTLFSGVHPIEFDVDTRSPNVTLREAEKELLRLGMVAEGDMIVLTVGESIGKTGHTNTMKIVRVGDHRKS